MSENRTMLCARMQADWQSVVDERCSVGGGDEAYVFNGSALGVAGDPFGHEDWLTRHEPAADAAQPGRVVEVSESIRASDVLPLLFEHALAGGLPSQGKSRHIVSDAGQCPADDIPAGVVLGDESVTP